MEIHTETFQVGLTQSAFSAQMDPCGDKIHAECTKKTSLCYCLLLNQTMWIMQRQILRFIFVTLKSDRIPTAYLQVHVAWIVIQTKSQKI